MRREFVPNSGKELFGSDWLNFYWRLNGFFTVLVVCENEPVISNLVKFKQI
jgi:hypothetical protein